MEKKLSFNEVLPMEELAPVELDAIVGGNAIKIVGTYGNHCSCGDTTHTTQTSDSTSVKKPYVVFFDGGEWIAVINNPLFMLEHIL